MGRGLAILFVALLAGGCQEAVTLESNGDPSILPAPVPSCVDSIEARYAASPQPVNLPGAAFFGTGDTFFIGLPGRRWGENVQYHDGVFDMKVSIYTLETKPPHISVTRLDGPGTGSVTFAPTGGGLPGPLPLGITFAGPGCWLLDAQGSGGFARIQVKVAAPEAGPG